jgi:eukaryotic-like serine/threonine-protein kinase
VADCESLALQGDRGREVVTSERWKQVESVFEQALELPVAERSQFLQRTCDGDEELRREVQSLLNSHARAGSFIDQRNLFVASGEIHRDDATVASGELIGAYRVMRELGRGGMGAVYLAERADGQYQKRVAIKLIKRGMDTDSVLRHFRKERQILAGFDHPNVARLFDAGTTATGLPYFVMEYVQGVPIDEYCNAHSLSIAQRLKLFCEVCAAVAYAHGRGVIHRDIKCSNIFATSDGVPKLLDFGIAKILQPVDGSETLLTTTGLRPMTPEYASPEQVRGEAVTTASDVYSLGVGLYQLLTGQQPYRLKTRTPEEISRAITEQEPARPSTAVGRRDGSSKSQTPNPKLLRGDLDNIALMALRKEPERRYQSVEQFSEDILRHLEGRPITARRVSRPARVWRWSRRNPALVGAASACLLLAIAVVWLLREQFHPRTTPVPEKSIAVLPFEYLSPDKTNAYLSDGTQEEILTRLSKIADLKVISRTSTHRYKSKPDNLPDIAKQLGVAHILEGSVQKSGDAVRVNVQLINARTDSHLWAEKYDRKLTDIFAVESEIATRIANTLQAKLTGSEQRAIAARPTENSEAYQLYLKGRYFWSKRTEEDLLRAIDYFDQAIAKDPKYARAYSGIADCYIVLPFFSKLSPIECRQKAKIAANKAIEIDNHLAEAHVSLGVLLIGGGKIPEAKREFLHAIDLDPNYANAPHWYANNVLVPLGQFDDAIAEFKRALELDPLSAPISANLGSAYAMARRYSDAILQLQKTIELDPGFSYGHGVLGYTFDVSGQFDQAIREYQKAYDLSHDFHLLSPLAHAYGLKGDREKAFQLLQQLQDLERQNLVWNFGFALVYLGLNDKNEALNRLEQSYRTGEGSISYIKVDPMFAPLRGDLRFEKLANKIILPELMAQGAPNKSSIAVLPFKPLTAEDRDQVLEMGMADTLITKLSSSRAIIIPSMGSVRKYVGSQQDPLAAGRELQVGSVLEGNVQRSGDRIRVSARLISVPDGASLWAGTFDEKFTDVFSVEDAIAQKVADALALRLTGEEQQRLTKRYTENVEAYQLYLTGRYHWARLIPQEIRTGIGFFRQAIEKDPNYALAYFGLAEANRSLAITSDVPSKDSLPQAKAAAMKALEIDDSLAEAHASLSFSLIWYDWDWRGGEREAERAIALNPNSAMAHFARAHALSDLGRHDEAIAEQARAIELEPVFLLLNALQGMFLYHARREDQATVQLEKTLQIDPNFWIAHLMLGKVYAQQRKYPEALAEFTKAKDFSHGNSEAIGSIGYVAGLAGDKAKALAVLDELKVRSAQSYIPPCNIALVYNGLGDNDEALRSLEKAVDQRDVRLTLLKVDPRWDSFRSNPQFIAILKRIGLQ